MNPRPTLYMCALALAGCNGDPGTSASGSSGGQSSSSTDDGTSGSSSTGSSGDLSTGTGTTGQDTTTGSSGDEPTTGTSTTGPVATTGTTGEDTETTTGEPVGPAPDWALIDVNPNSATYEQTRARSDYAGSVSGWYFAHAT